MPRYRFEEIAINSTEKKKPVEPDKETYIGLEHLDSGCLEVTRWGSDVAPIGDKLVMRKGDLLFGRRRAYQKKVAIAPFDGIFSAHGMVLRPKENVIRKGFFPFFISSDYFLDAAIKISVGSLSPTINWRDLAKLEFDIPDLEAQDKLTGLLWEMNRLKTAYTQLLNVSDKLVQSQFVEMFGIPEFNTYNYTVETIGDLCSDVHYGTSSKAGDNGHYICLRMNNITYSGEIDLKDVKYIDLPDKELEGCLVRKGDVLFNRTNSKELVGKTCAFMLETPMVIAGYIIRLRMNGKVTANYLSTYMNLPSSKKLLLSMAKGAVGQANINAQEVKSIIVLVPPMDKQLEFEQLLSQTDKSKLAIRESLEALEKSKVAIMNSVFC